MVGPVSVPLGGLGRDALKLALALAVALTLALAFAIASVVTLVGSDLPGLAPGGTRVEAIPADQRAAGYGSVAPGAPPSGVVALARAQLGLPYVWGGASPSTSFDCSGLVQWVYGQNGVRLPRTAQGQYDATARVPTDQLQPGDLLFYEHTYASADTVTHVGIYIGDGQMINAPTTGDVVRVMPAFDGYWADHFAGAGRVAR